MKSRDREKDALADLLKEVLRDDLPPGLEVRMRNRFAAAGSAGKNRETWRKTKLGWPSPAFRKEALAFSSVAAIIFGGFLHLGGHRPALAESIFTLNTLFSVSAEIRAAGTMDCRAEFRANDGTSSTYLIRWSSPETSRVEVRRAEQVTKIIEISPEGIFVSEGTTNTRNREPNLEQVKDPSIRPVMVLLTRDLLLENLNARWQFLGREAGRGEGDVFHFADRERGILVDIGLDSSSRLPATISVFESDSGSGRPEIRSILSARLRWDRPAGPLNPA